MGLSSTQGGFEAPPPEAYSGINNHPEGGNKSSPQFNVSGQNVIKYN
jgi:hypothetical protein